MKTYLERELEELTAYIETLNKARPDMQGLIARGYSHLNAASFLMLKIISGTEAKQYFNWLISNHFITSAVKHHKMNVDEPPGPTIPAPVSQASGKKKYDESIDPEHAVQLALTGSGLKKLGLPDLIIDTFSREFIEGMGYADPELPAGKYPERSTLLGDTGANAPANWKWGNQANPVDCLLMLYAPDSDSLERLYNNVYGAAHKGVELVYTATTYHSPHGRSKEHFGFRDGISQPLIKGFKKSETEFNAGHLLNPGEFILGYKNEYGSYSPSPYAPWNEASADLPVANCYSDKKDLGKNGTYLVFRQMQQHVETFWHFMHTHAKEDGRDDHEKAVKLASKMIGRWPSGEPLVLKPNYPEKPSGLSDRKLNDFNYSREDEFGIRCPYGAHIRRSNPRDQTHAGRDQLTSLEMSKRHQMLRRGRIYGTPLAEQMDIPAMLKKISDYRPSVAKQEAIYAEAGFSSGRGLHFICLVSDIQRQFEFVQNVWANTSTFAALCREVDPIISPRPPLGMPACHEFTAPGEMVRNRYANVPQFTTVRGGAYFFLPGFIALKYIMGSKY